MNYNKKTVYDIDVAGKKVLLRCDFNVPQDKHRRRPADHPLPARAGRGGHRLLTPRQARAEL